MSLSRFKQLLNEFQHRIEDVEKEFQDAIADIPGIYKESYISTQTEIERKKRAVAIAELQDDFIKRADMIRRELHKKESVTDDSYIDYALLQKLNTISQADIDLTKEEYLQLITECVASNSAACSRKLKQIIKQKNLEDVSFPSASDSKAMIDSITERVAKGIKDYGKADKTKEYGSWASNQRILRADWLDKENEKFSRMTTADIKGKVGNGLKEALSSKVNVEKLGDGSSYAKEYVLRHNKEMARKDDKKDENGFFVDEE